MAKKKQEPKPVPATSNPPGRHTTPRKGIQLPEPWAGLLNSIAKGNHRPFTTELKLAIRAYADSLGKWPPPGEDPDSEKWAI